MFSDEEKNELNEKIEELINASSRKAKDILINIIINTMKKLDYSFVELTSMYKGESAVDIIAKRGSRLLALKISPYIDNFDNKKSVELKNLAAFINASPIIIGVRGRRFDQLDDGLVLFRYEIPVVSPETFLNLLIDGLSPIIYCYKGGYYVKINRKILRKARVDHGLSYNSLAQMLGVSRRTVYEYEHSINPSPEIAIKLEDIFNVSLTQGIQIFNLKIETEPFPTNQNFSLSPIKSEVANLLKELGIFSQFWMKKMPFDAYGEHLSKNNTRSGLNILLCVDDGNEKEEEIVKRINITKRISSIAKRRPIMVVEDKDHIASEHVPTFTLDELQEMQRAFQLVKEYMNKYTKLKEALGQ